MFSFLKQNTKTVNVNEIDQLLGKIELIDIREPYEYHTGAIQSAKNIPMDQLLATPQKYISKEKEYYIVCHSGGRSSMACNHLTKQGYQVINVIGGVGSYQGNNII
ncbi:rhodanese-like domain-containing protein [Anaeromicropila herbilytica]|uniref:Sulfurtransferase n=1 Tax=Anaeromicropila herbilytica TaxID=2785025 RepID=A0A7R7EL98_9FIRM|nr:rhodanese-like domain-containing protein [Anaeromicropila herbilytica]BCN30680.1 sulfurtransferase [Anaeromicropila herbilytica]